MGRVTRIPRPIGALLLACAAAACGRAVEHDPSRLAAADTVPANVLVTADTMTIGGSDTIGVPTVIPTTDTVPEGPDPNPDPEPRPGAVGCRRTDKPRPVPDSVIVQDLSGGARFSCVLREGRPPADVRVDVYGPLSYVGGMQVTYPAGSPRRPQSLDAIAEGGLYNGAPIVEAIDYDGDGWADLRTQEWAGATGNVKYHVFRFDPRRQRFARDSVLSELTGAEPIPGRPCVQGYLKNGGRQYDSWTRCLERGRWVESESVSQVNPPGKPFYVRVRKERRGGRMVVVRTDTLTAAEAWEHQ